MNRFIQEFFWTPTETVGWIKKVVPSFELWLVLWRPGSDAQLLEATELQPSMFENGIEDAIQIFLGSIHFSGAPVWREAGGRRLLDFQRSFAVQFAPPVITPGRDILLQGQMGILRLSQYEDSGRATQLSELFRRLQTSMKQASDPSRAVVQVLSNGKKKRWNDMLIGAAVPDRGLQLKQFAKGAVTFGLERQDAPGRAVWH